jgi:hypothetical protein
MAEKIVKENEELEFKNQALQKELERMKGKWWIAVTKNNELSNVCHEALLHLCGNGSDEAERDMIKKLQDTLERFQ